MVERRSPKPHVGGSSPSWPASVVEMFEKVKSFLEEVKVEIKKVVWPKKREIVTATIAVLVFSFVVSILLGLLDFIFSYGLEKIFK